MRVRSRSGGKSVVRHFNLPFNDEGVLCSVDRTGGVTDVSLVTCNNCLTSLRSVANNWKLGQSIYTSLTGLIQLADASKLGIREVVVFQEYAFTRTHQVADDVTRILRIHKRNTQPINETGGYSTKLSAEAHRCAYLLMSEAHKVAPLELRP